VFERCRGGSVTPFLAMHARNPLSCAARPGDVVDEVGLVVGAVVLDGIVGADDFAPDDEHAATRHIAATIVAPMPSVAARL